ncbi:2,3-diaminopropionate biosynthesis protein SbnB [Brevibacillus laterosporus]|nr:2,3-diaminopropionate biosynthesis protein SbnB [Brevibacillus laterosporus]RAP31091.1 Ornithine cyclodeaminase [Brevibacillus laterosporus]TPG68251.1 2,3-diaminopropionate biosynthesis protein SbnB [Brevibacillus laterosporus]TPG88621.1 2,3-diaminopropionate biosynthesis protein SbnB [Brevibacillus laterosporus]
MRYLHEKDLLTIGMNWDETTSVIEEAVKCLHQNDFAQPIKPYLRYGQEQNRIIAMPAFVGGTINQAGIKWIASFPNNIQQGVPRAHSVTILNNADNGVPEAVVNTALLSVIRTASVSGMIIKHYDRVRNLKDITVGIIGWGPIGQYHFKMVTALLGDRIKNIYLFDLRPIDSQTIDSSFKDKVIIAKSWEEAYKNSDIFMTCTVSKAPYIDVKPKTGALLLNVSLRDFTTDIYPHVKDSIIVDSWEEVCRENTDIESMHLQCGLQKENTQSIINVVCDDAMNNYREDQAIMFNPMGMAVFDISMGHYFLRKAEELKVGQLLE